MYVLYNRAHYELPAYYIASSKLDPTPTFKSLKLMCLLSLQSTTKDHNKHMIILCNCRGRHLRLSKQIIENCEIQL